MLLTTEGEELEIEILSSKCDVVVAEWTLAVSLSSQVLLAKDVMVLIICVLETRSMEFNGSCAFGVNGYVVLKSWM